MNRVLKRIKKIFRLGRLKDALVVGLFVLAPRLRTESCVRVADAVGIVLRLLYFIPFTRFRAAPRDLWRIGANAAGPKEIYHGFVQGVVFALKAYVRLYKEGLDAIIGDIVFEEGASERLASLREQYGAVICVVPHCAGSVLAAGRFTRALPTFVLVREPKWERRRHIQVDFLRLLGLRLLLLRGLSKVRRSRRILQALREGYVLIGTTDLARRSSDSIEVAMFGTRVALPAWPARFAIRRRVPIVPSYVRVHNGRIRVACGEPIVGADPTEVTARWAAAFERDILDTPSDWVFMFDKRWKRILSDATG